MRKFMLFIALVSVGLFGCSGEPKQSAGVSADTPAQPEAVKNYQPNPQVPDDRPLQQTGQMHADEKGKITLQKGSCPGDTYTIGPIEMKVIEAKIIQLKPDYSLVDYYHSLTDEEEFNFVKIFVEIKNLSEEKVHFAPVAILETSEGEKITWENDIYLDGLNEEIKPGQTKAGNVGFIVKRSDLEFVQLTTSDVFDANGQKTNDGKKVQIRF